IVRYCLASVFLWTRVGRDFGHNCISIQELRRLDIRSMFPPKSPFRALFGAFYPHPAHQSALRAEGATHFLAPGQRGCSTVPLATVLPPPAPRPTPGPAGSGRAQTLPPAYCMQPTAELTKVEQDPISTSGASIFSMSPNQAIPTEKLIRFFPTPPPNR